MLREWQKEGITTAPIVFVRTGLRSANSKRMRPGAVRTGISERKANGLHGHESSGHAALGLPGDRVREIQVPFPYEIAASGVSRTFL